MNTVIEVADLSKRYGGRTVVDAISFEVERGEIFGLVGPNGAGKTTTIECIEGLRRGDGGTVRTLGLDPASARSTLNQRIGIQLQDSNLPLRIRVREAVDLFGSFYRERVPTREILERLDLWDERNTAFGKLSGGQRQRLFIALALINRPELVFLDELTTGLDPHARRSTWALIEEIRAQGTTVCLTTHFMEEAERLCDRVGILDRGKIVALDSPSVLIRSLGDRKRLILSTEGTFDLETIRALDGVRHVNARDNSLEVEGEGDELATELLAQLSSDGVRIRDLRTEDGTLEDVFLHLTGNEPTRGEERCEA